MKGRVFCLFLLAVIAALFSFAVVYAEDMHVYPAEIGYYYDCEGEFEIGYVYRPIMTKASSNMLAKGEFIMVRVRIKNESGYTMNGFSRDSFYLAQNTGKKEIVFPLDWNSSMKTSKIWDMRRLDRQLGTFEELDTWLVFDVNGNWNDPWYLIFKPMDDYNREPLCTLRLSLPKIDRK